MAYIHVAIARGSPCVVPSRDDMYWPSTNSQELFRYVLIKTGAMAGQTTSMLRRASCLLSRLNALEASTKITASVSSSSNI